MREPTSTAECVYYTDRIFEKGSAKAWAFKELCPKCGKALMSKPIVKGKVKIRAEEYQCPECKYTLPKQEYEDSLTANIKYICPYCQSPGEAQIPFQRKKVKIIDEETLKKTTVETLRTQCSSCKKNIDITKRMK